MTGGDGEDEPTKQLPNAPTLRSKEPAPADGARTWDEPDEQASTERISPLAPPGKGAPITDTPTTNLRRTVAAFEELDDSVELHKDPTGEWLFPEKEADTLSKPHPIPVLTGEPASLAQRLGAWGIDLALILGAAWAVAGSAVVRDLPFFEAQPSVAVAGVVMVSLGILYELFGSLLWGRSVGRLLLGVQVVDASGEPPGILRCCARAILSIASWVGGFGLTLIDPKGQMLHEKLTSTWVIRTGTGGLR